ncbi:glutamate-5-semialdehyde dehydrogenase [Aliiglaciecola sp.]|nr:glutamate-5-semialdehyde dehydrogenase [Aliiglaciecola sp.]
MNSLDDYTLQLAQHAAKASQRLSVTTTEQRNRALAETITALYTHRDDILDANAKEIQRARTRDYTQAFIDRLEITPDRFEKMIQCLESVIALPEVIGTVSNTRELENGIELSQMRVPLGVICMIYESRPNVTIEAAALCIKTANAVILRGGSNAIYSNLLLSKCIKIGLQREGIPQDSVQVVGVTDREAVQQLIAMDKYIDLVIPRGGKGLIEQIAKHATVPVLKHLDGICHVYIDQFADHEKAVAIADNAKNQRYGTCNTMETLLIHECAAETILKDVIRVMKNKNTELRGCEKTVAHYPTLKAATECDWATEYLAPILSIKIVADITEAIKHINHYGSKHTDAIVTQDKDNSVRFQREVDSASVMVNASTRLADGFEYGLGAEIGISTDKFHARGPVGLEGLTSNKYIVTGDCVLRT